MTTEVAATGSGKAIRLLWLMFASYFTFGIVLNVVGVMIPLLIGQYRLTLFEGGLMAFALYIPFGIWSIPAGLAVDRFGPKPIVLSGLVMMAAGCEAMPWLHGFSSIMVAALAIGSGIALLETAGNPLIERLDSPERYHRNLTLTIGFCGIGAFAGPFCLSALQSHGQPWQRLYEAYAVLCALLVLLLACSSFPERDAANPEKVHPREIGKLLRHPIAITYFLGIFFYVGAEVGTASWIVKFFQQVYGMGTELAGHAGHPSLLRSLPALPALTVSLFWGLQGVGRLTSAPGIRKLGARSMLRLYAVGATCFLLLAAYGPRQTAAAGFMACGFFTSVLFTLIFSGAIHTFVESRGTLSGLLVTASIGGGVIPPLVGLCADHFGIRIAMMVPLACFLYVLAISMFGGARYD